MGSRCGFISNKRNKYNRGVDSGGIKMENTLSGVIEVFRDFFEAPDMDVTLESNVDNLKGWDSIAHIQIIFELEEHFGITFDADEIMRLTSVKEIVNCIEGHMA